jgi:hypothetical protein
VRADEPCIDASLFGCSAAMRRARARRCRHQVVERQDEPLTCSDAQLVEVLSRVLAAKVSG